jgi:HPt (histidine-containing phosphotransfer) domain-containing protein
MTGGTEAGYRKVLSQFGKDLEERLPFFAAPPDTTELAAFAVHAHALKSAAGTIGAGEVSGEAARLEAAGKSGDMETLRELQPGFYTRLSALAKGIETALSAEAPGRSALEKKDADEAGGAAFISNLEALKGALELKKVQVIDKLLEEMEQLTEDGKTRETLSLISDQVLMSEYEEALKMADTLLREAEPSRE